MPLRCTRIWYPEILKKRVSYCLYLQIPMQLYNVKAPPFLLSLLLLRSLALRIFPIIWCFKSNKIIQNTMFRWQALSPLPSKTLRPSQLCPNMPSYSKPLAQVLHSASCTDPVEFRRPGHQDRQLTLEDGAHWSARNLNAVGSKTSQWVRTWIPEWAVVRMSWRRTWTIIKYEVSLAVKSGNLPCCKIRQFTLLP